MVGVVALADAVGAVLDGGAGVPLPEGDQPLIPPGFLASTCTSQVVPSVSSGIVAVRAVPVCGQSVNPPLLPIRYCTS